ncbi:hypothetical protein [Marinomonas pollencensis]|uniref:hypothetical protein n=1 Tax=Marinomonas pollencensis TaxID=491954 RepID=UPI000E26AD09|nr:hypothetical protein [Marinomonas pollencensis]
MSPDSSAIQTLAEALDRYPIAPELGLLNVKQALFTLSQVFSDNHTPPCVQQRTQGAILSLDHIIRTQPIYDPLLFVALHEMLDGFEQYVLAYGLGEAYLHIALPRFEQTGFCWRLLEQKKEQAVKRPIHAYEAHLNAVTASAMIPQMSQLAGLGEVSFHLNMESQPSQKGYFKLLTVQPFDWLQKSFPMFSWRHSRCRNLEYEMVWLASSYALAFLSAQLPRGERQRLLDSMSEWIRVEHYRAFSMLFTRLHQEVVIEQGDSLVPGALQSAKTTLIAGQLARPERIAGCYFKALLPHASLTQTSSPLLASATQYTLLGRDVLSSWLCVIDLGRQRLAFAQSDFMGCFSLQNMQLQSLGSNRWMCHFDCGLSAELEIDSELFSVLDGRLESHSGEGFELFVTQQCSRNIAIAIKGVVQLEGICAFSLRPSGSTKNIWLTAQGECFVEPWLTGSRTPAPILTELQSLPTRVNDVKRTGYYQLMFTGGVLWVAANLVADLISIASGASFYLFSREQKVCERGLLHGMEYYSQIVSLDVGQEGRFALLLAGHRCAFLSSSVAWCDKLPDQLSVTKINQLNLVKHEHAVWQLASRAHHEHDFVINTDNISNFIHYLWPQHSVESASNYD